MAHINFFEPDASQRAIDAVSLIYPKLFLSSIKNNSQDKDNIVQF